MNASGTKPTADVSVLITSGLIVPSARSRRRRARGSTSSSMRVASMRATSCPSCLRHAGRRPADTGAYDRLDDPALAELVAADLVDDPAAGDHDDPVAEAGELERVARLDDRRNALRRLRPHRVVDVEARADVNALGRLLGEDDVDVPAEERARQRNLLLVPARKGLHGLLDRRHANAQLRRE